MSKTRATLPNELGQVINYSKSEFKVGDHIVHAANNTWSGTVLSIDENEGTCQVHWDDEPKESTDTQYIHRLICEKGDANRK